MQVHHIVFIVLGLIGIGALVAIAFRLDTLLRRVASIRKHMSDERDAGVGSQLTEAIAQLQSVAVSLDRIAERCDGLEMQVTQIVQRGPGGGGGEISETVDALRSGFDALRSPLADIHGLLAQSNVERLREAVTRTLFNLGYDKVNFLTDLASIEDGSGRVQVEVTREGVKAKGYVVLNHGSVDEHKISSAYEMFP